MMAPPQDPQLEKLVDEVLKNSNFQALGDFLQDDEGTTWKCSKQFLAKLDKLVSRELDHRNVKHACLGLAILHKFGKNLALPGGQGLSGMVLQGLVKKMVQWFEKARLLWIEACTQRNETLLNLAEDLFDSVMVVHESSQEGTYQVTECFLHLIGQLAADPRVHIMIQKEAIRKLNIILDKIPAELKKEKKILSSQGASDVMNNLASRIVDGGDYDLQIALMEALCRMTTRAQRKELADDWFSMEFVASTFSKIQDSEFETDCRRFLNLLNGMQGDGRRVFSYPCLEVFLDKHELLMPSDEKLEEFWIDFNLGSQSVSFYFSLADEDAQEGQWDTACIPENEVHSYTVTEEGRRKVLKLKLTEPLCVSGVEGSYLTIHFSSSLDIMQAARSVYGNKNKSFVGKRRTSVVKTTVKIVMDDNCSQALVPESQMSPDADVERERDSVPCLLPPRPSGPLQMVTPAKRRVSESSTFITSSGGGRGTGASPFSVVMAASTPGGSRPKVKPALELVRSCERQGQSDLGELRTAKPYYNSRREQMDAVVALSQSKATKQDTRAGPVAEKYRRHIPVDKVVEMVQTDQGEEEKLLDSSIVPDSQPTMKTERTIFSHWRKVSVSEMLLPVQRCFQKALPKPELENVEQQERPSSAQRGSGSVPGSAVSHKQLHAQLTQRLEEVLRKRDRGTGPEERAGAQIRVPEERGGPQDRGSREQARAQGRRGPEERDAAQGGSGPEEQSGAQGGRGPDEQDGAQGGRGPEERGEPTGRGAKESRQDAGRPGQTKGKEPKSQKSQETEATPGKAPVKPTPAKDIQERATPNSKVKATGSNSSKDKREEEVTGTMMRLISSHYENSTSSTTIKSPVESVPRWPLPPTNRSVLEKSWLPPSMVGTAKAPGYMKSYTNSKKPSAKQQGDDVFAFKVDTSMTTGGEGKMSSDTSAIDSSAIHNSWAFPSTAKKGQAVKSQVAAPRRHVKKHLFSDTDTDTMMEISWLKESSRKPKPKVIDYSRQPRLHLPTPNTTYESPDLPPSSPKPGKEKAKPKKKRQRVKERSVEQKENNGAALVAAGTSQAARRPQRAAATNAKSYREPDSASQSETEEPPAPKKRSIGPAQKSEKVCQEAVEVKKKKATTPAKEQTNVPKESSWAARLASFNPSPPAIERMRAASERSLIALPRSPLTPLGSLSASPASGPTSPLALELPPEHPRSSAGFQPSSFYSVPGRKSDRKAKDPPLPSLPSLTPTGKTPGLRAQRPSALELSPIQPALSLAQSPLCPPSQLLLTSTALQKSVLPSPLLQSQPSPGETEQFTLHFGSPGQLGLPESFDKDFLDSRVKLSQSSSRSEMSSTRVEVVNPAALTTALEKTPYSERRHKLDQRSFHLSGPCTGRKRHNSRPSSSNSEEEGKRGTRRGGQAVKMRPRKLFKPTAKPNLHAQAQAWEEQSSSDEEEKKGHGTKDRASLATTKRYHHIQSSKSARDTVMDVSPEGDLSRVVSSHMVTSSSWEADVDVEAEVEGELGHPPHDMGNMCRQFSSELQRKFQNRSRRMELYTKQSLKTVQQHVSSISVRVQNYRSQKLEQVRGVLLNEINNLEEDESTLKNMEKELTTYWMKQSVAFHSYQEKETRRLQSLKSTFQTDVCHSLEYEERIFTSQMCLMRKDMKSVQDRLFKEMQDEEIMSVRRGLQALFLPEGPRF